jgi:hypothetical protein
VYLLVTKVATDQIAKQFEEPRIRATLTEVAETRASKIIEDQLNPAINDAKTTIDSLKGNLRQDVDKIRADFKNELNDLRREVEFQKKLREIQRLEVTAIIDCDIRAFHALQHYPDEDRELHRFAQTSIYSIKQSYLTGTRFTLYGIQIDSPDGSIKTIDDIETSSILQMIENSSPQGRGTAILLLRNDKHTKCGVPEALLKRMNTDDSLCVRVEALKMFMRHTHFPAPDVFAFEEAQNWFNKNRNKIRKIFNCNDEEQ